MTEWETIKQQCSGFNEMGFVVKCDIQSQENGGAPQIRIAKGIKTWNFSDPDCNIVIKQLAQLWKTITANTHVKIDNNHK